MIKRQGRRGDAGTRWWVLGWFCLACWRAAAQTLPSAISVQWTAPYHAEMTGTEPVWFGRDGSALLGQLGRTNWLWVAVDGRRATLSDPYLADLMQNWSIIHMTSRALITEVRAGGMMSTNSVWRWYRRGEDGSVSMTVLGMDGTAYPPTSSTTAILSGRSVTRSVSRLPPDGWFAGEVDTGTGPMGPEPNRLLTLYKLDATALEGGAARPALSMEHGEPMRLRIELDSLAPLVVHASEDLKDWLPWAVLLEPGPSVELLVSNSGKGRRYFMAQQMDWDVAGTNRLGAKR